MSRPKNVYPEAAEKIAALRKALNLNQHDFATKMGVGRIAALYWESGRSQPSAETYVRMAKAAKEVDPTSAAWFWQQVGVDTEALKDLLPEYEKALRKTERHVKQAREKAADQVVAVPLLRTTRHINAPPLAPEEDVELWYPLAYSIVLNPGTTCCMRVPNEMAFFGGNDLVVCDSANISVDRKRLTKPSSRWPADVMNCRA